MQQAQQIRHWSPKARFNGPGPGCHLRTQLCTKLPVKLQAEVCSGGSAASQIFAGAAGRKQTRQCPGLGAAVFACAP